MKLEKNERIDDLEYKNLKIIQNKEGFCFGIDSVLLSDFAKEIKPNSKIIDLGTGTGILGILLSGKTQNTQIVGIEIQEEVAKMAKKSIALNQLENRFEIICDNIKNVKQHFQPASFDAVVTNPPYQKIGTGAINEENKKLISRHEIAATLEDFIEMSYYLLKDQGSLYIVHKPERLVEIFFNLRKAKLEPKKIRFVHPDQTKGPNLVLIKAVKHANQFLTVEKPLYIYQQNGNYTDEVLQIYHQRGETK